jgi:phosphoesterase family protein
MSNPVNLAGGAPPKTVFRLGTTVGIHDPGHSFHATRQQRGGYTIDLPAPLHDVALPPNAGFVIDYAGRLQRAGVPADEIAKHVADVMGFYGASDLPAYSQLAEDFMICDRWFAAHPGSTWPNRFISLTGALAPGPDGRPELDNPHFDLFDPLDVRSIFDHLDAAHVDWRYFEHDICFLRLFERYTDDRRIVRVDDPEHGFFALARAGTLPPVTYVEPNITDLPPGNDDHPPSDLRRGQQLVAAVYNALRNGPQWKDTLFIITYDEHGGFFDHIHPADGACAALCHDPETGDPVTHYGMRVPTFVISPHVRKRFVAKDVYDHTTILKTIIQTFLYAHPPDMGPRVAAARSLESQIDVPILDRRPIAIEHLPAPAPEPALVLAREPGDFHALMTRLAMRRKPAGTVIHDHR